MIHCYCCNQFPCAVTLAANATMRTKKEELDIKVMEKLMKNKDIDWKYSSDDDFVLPKCKSELEEGVTVYPNPEEKEYEQQDDKVVGKTENEQLGTNPKDSLGTKKVSLSKVPFSSIVYQALAMEDGAKKYGPFNWRENKVIASIYIDAAMRHLGSWYDGEEVADDSKKPHLGHAMACIGIIIDALETGNLVDDRPVKGNMAELIEKWKK